MPNPSRAFHLGVAMTTEDLQNWEKVFLPTYTKKGTIFSIFLKRYAVKYLESKVKISCDKNR